MKSRTLSQIDIFATIKSMYNLQTDYTLGVDMFTEDKSFAIDPKVLDIITDDFMYNLKNGEYYLENIDYDEMITIIEEIKKFKLENDSHLTRKISS